MKKTVEEVKDLVYWKNNAKDLIMYTPIGMLRYVRELELKLSHLQSENAELKRLNDK